MLKYYFDLIVSAGGLLLLSPLMIVVAGLIKLNSNGPVFFRQERIGKDFQPFQIYKFRTMVQDGQHKGFSITFGDDPRITSLGRFLRRSKIDELPQLINVLKGEMSLVGPRPEIREFVDLYREEYREILKVRPGITDTASIKYRDEANALVRAENPEEEYRTRILPDKLRLSKEYVQNASFFFDLKLILATILRLFTLARSI